MRNRYFRSKSEKQTEVNEKFSGIQELLDTEISLIGYNKNLVFRFSAEMKSRSTHQISNSSLLDFGAGSGSLAEIWRKEFNISPVCFEIDPDLKSILLEKGFQVSDLKNNNLLFSFIYSSNVLEHIEDDTSAVRSLKEILIPGGVIVIYVPAIPLLYSEMDFNIGHFRRYTRKELVRIVESSGLKVHKCVYNDSLGFFVSLVLKIFRMHPSDGNSSQLALRIYDFLIYPISRILDNFGFRKIVGKNLLLVATRPED